MLGLALGIDYLSGIGEAESNIAVEAVDLRQRVEADGGIIESIQCLSDAIYAFPQADRGRQLFDAYDARCEAASGDTEARVCTINELNDLL